MRHLVSILVLVALTGCGSRFVTKSSLVGFYDQEGIISALRHEIELLPDGSFTMTLVAFLYDPNDQDERDRWANRISGTWVYNEGAITLLPTVEKDGNPSARLGLDPRKFRVERTLMHIRLISLGSDGGLSLRK